MHHFVSFVIFGAEITKYGFPDDIRNFPLSSLTQSVNLLRLDINYLSLEEDSYPEIVAEMMPKIRKFRTLSSSQLTTKLLRAKLRDGRPAFNFMDLRRFSTYIGRIEDEQNVRYLLQNAMLLEKLRLSSVARGHSLEGLLSPSARNLKVLDLSVPLWDGNSIFLGGTCEGLEALAGHNMLEAFKLCVGINSDVTEGFIGSILQKVENILVKPGWSALRRVSFKVQIIRRYQENATRLCEALQSLQSLPDKYFSHLSKLESLTFNYQTELY